MIVFLLWLYWSSVILAVLQISFMAQTRIICLLMVGSGLGFCGMFNKPAAHTAQRKSNKNEWCKVWLKMQDITLIKNYFYIFVKTVSMLWQCNIKWIRKDQTTPSSPWSIIAVWRNAPLLPKTANQSQEEVLNAVNQPCALVPMLTSLVSPCSFFLLHCREQGVT